MRQMFEKAAMSAAGGATKTAPASAASAAPTAKAKPCPRGTATC